MTGPQTAEGWVLKLARERQDLSSSELHVLITLAARHNRDHCVAHPKVDLLHRETHLSVRQVLRILTALADPDRPGGPVLHISHGPLPVLGKNGRPVYGNAYRFIGFDPIPAEAGPRRRDVVDTRPNRSDTTSHTASDTTSLRSCDTGDRPEVTPADGSCDTGDRIHVTSARLPLYPVGNPASTEGLYPDGNPARVRAREASKNDRSNCIDCGRRIRPPSLNNPRPIEVTQRCEACRSNGGHARASPALASVGDLIRG